MIARRCRQIADSSRFQTFIMGVIVANAVTLDRLETQLAEGGGGDLPAPAPSAKRKRPTKGGRMRG